ncbi:hypothetical protein DIPPA_33163 [Diplonema papillatum]|nr:hypothetical protein DIPPA_33163 [Diplonema papillatum]
MLLFKQFGCNVDDVDLEEAEELDWEFHPTRIGITTGARQYMIAAMIMNPIVILLIFLVGYAVAGALYRFYNISSVDQACGNMKLPGFLYVPYLFLLQGTSLVSSRLVFYPKNDPVFLTVLSAVVMVGCFVSPCVIYYYVLRRAASRARYMKESKSDDEDLVQQSLSDSTTSGNTRQKAWWLPLHRFAFGEYTWENQGDECFVEKYGIVFEGMKRTTLWYPFVEMMTMNVLSLLVSWPARSLFSCTLRNSIICALLAVFLVVTVVKSPFVSPFDNIASSAANSTTLVAVILLTVGIGTEAEDESTFFVVASYTLIVATFIILCKAAWDLCVTLLDLWLGRKNGARNMSTANKSKESLDEMNELSPQAESALLESSTASYSKLSEQELVGTPLRFLVIPAEKPHSKRSTSDAVREALSVTTAFEETLLIRSPSSRGGGGGSSRLSELPISPQHHMGHSLRPGTAESFRAMGSTKNVLSLDSLRTSSLSRHSSVSPPSFDDSITLNISRSHSRLSDTGTYCSPSSPLRQPSGKLLRRIASGGRNAPITKTVSDLEAQHLAV